MAREKILAVDDDPLNLAIMEELLGEEYDLTTAEGGAEALALAERLRPDLVLMDIMMPGLDGYEACSRMRERDCLKHTKIVLVSAKAMLAERLRGYQAGADDYVTKPFDHAELLAKIKVFLRLKFMEEMDALKTEFLILVAHETRTPLTKLLLMSEMLGGDVPLKEAERRYLARMMRDTSEQVRSLFDRGLQYCVLRAGQSELTSTSFDVVPALHGALAALTDKAELLSVELTADAPATLEMESDAGQVRLVLQLLLESAVERAGKHGRVRATLGAEEDSIRVEVRGPGRVGDAIALHLLLEPFRAPDVDHHTSSGALNLPLAAELIRALQGELKLALEGQETLVLQATLPRRITLAAPGRDEAAEAKAA